VSAKFEVVAEDGLALRDELGDAAGEDARDAGEAHEAVGGGGDDDFGRGVDVGGADGGGGLVVFGVEDGGVDGGDAAQGPLGVGELEDDAELVGVLGQEPGLDVGDELVVGFAVLDGEDDGATGVTPVFEAVHRGDELAFGGFGPTEALAIRALRRL